MRSLIFVIASFCITILCWGVYVPVLHEGQHAMSTVPGGVALLRPFVCVGLAYFLIGVIVPAALLYLRGEAGAWSMTGIVWSLAGGVLGALGALGIIMAISFGGKPIYVAPLVFGGAPVVNAFLTIYLARRMRDIGPFFLAGLVMVILGAVTVLVSAPKKTKVETTPAAAAAGTTANAGTPAAKPGLVNEVKEGASHWALRLLSIATTIVCWGSYGVTLHKGQAKMSNSRLRPFICVGLAYFVIAVVVPNLLLAVNPEASAFNFSGTMWSLLGGAAGAVGALGIIMAFNFGGKPMYVMPLVYGGAPVVATLVATFAGGLQSEIGPMFLAGLILVIAGAAMVLVFAPKGHLPAPAPAPKPTPPPVEPAAEPVAE